MGSFTNTTTSFLQFHIVTKPQNFRHKISLPVIRASFPGEEHDQENNATSRRKIVTTFLVTTMALGAHQHGVATPLGLAENWGVRSFIRERFFEPGLSPEDAVARIRQTAEGLHSMRDMLEAMAWRYVIFYIRLKSAYLSQDLKNAVNLVPEGRRSEYAKTANELVDNMAEVVALVDLSYKLAFIKAGQNSWIFAVDNRSIGRIVSLDVYLSDSHSPPPKLKLLTPRYPSDKLRRAYLVESTKGDLLQVQRFYGPREPDIKWERWLTKEFKVYKWEINEDDELIVNKVEVENIGEEALFVSASLSVSVLASEYPGCLPNSIYYIDEFIPCFKPLRDDET